MVEDMMVILLIVLSMVLSIVILCLVKFVEYTLSKIAEIKKCQFLYAKLLNLNEFVFHKTISSERYSMIIKEAREKGIYLTKEEVDLFSEQLNRMQEK